MSHPMYEAFYNRAAQNFRDAVQLLDDTHGIMFTSKVVAEILQRLYFHLQHQGIQMRRTYQIEVKIDFEDPRRHEEMQIALRQAAKLAYTQALLLADGKEPQIALRSEDFFEGTEDIQILTSEDMEEL